jgi:hypothetical protein
MIDGQSIQSLNQIGTLGLGVLVWGLIRLLTLIIKGDLVTRREHEGALTREARLQAIVDKALTYGDRALGAGETLAAKK